MSPTLQSLYSAAGVCHKHINVMFFLLYTDLIHCRGRFKMAHWNSSVKWKMYRNNHLCLSTRLHRERVRCGSLIVQCIIRWQSTNHYFIHISSSSKHGSNVTKYIYSSIVFKQQIQGTLLEYFLDMLLYTFTLVFCHITFKIAIFHTLVCIFIPCPVGTIPPDLVILNLINFRIKCSFMSWENSPTS